MSDAHDGGVPSRDREATGRLADDGLPAAASWEWDAYEADGLGFAELTLDFGGLEAELMLTTESAERFIKEARAAVVAAKKEELEATTTTSSETGVSDD